MKSVYKRKRKMNKYAHKTKKKEVVFTGTIHIKYR